MSRFPAHRTTPWLMNSDPLSKSMPSTRWRDRVHGGVQGRDDAPCRRRPRIERVKVHPVSTSGRAQRSGRTPRFEHRTAVGDGDGPRRGPGSASTSPAGPADLDGAAQAGTGPWPWTGRARRGPRPGRDSGRWSPRSWPPGSALTAGFVAGLAVELTGPLQQVQQQRHGLLEVLTALPAAGRPHPLEDLQSVVGVLAGPAPGLRPPTARWAPGRRHQAPACVVPAPARDRADPAPASVPCPSSTPSRTSPAYFPVISALARTGQPASHARHGPRFSRAVPREAPGALRGHPR